MSTTVGVAPEAGTTTIDLSPYRDAIGAAMDDKSPVTVATSGAGGMPDLALKGSFMVWDKDHVAFWERSHGETLAALEVNPRFAAQYRSAHQPRPLRFDGVVLQILTDGELRDQIWERVIEVEKSKDPEKKGIAILARVDRVRSGADVIAAREGSTK